MRLLPQALVSKVAAWSLVAALALSAWSLVVHPVMESLSEKSEATERLVRLLQEYRNRQEPLAPLRAQLTALETGTQSESGYFSGNAASMTANLQTTIRQEFTRVNGTLRSMQVIPPPPNSAAPFKYILRVDGALPQDALLDLLYAVETANPYLFFETLELRSAETADRMQPIASPLSLRADIVGYARAAGARP